MVSNEEIKKILEKKMKKYSEELETLKADDPASDPARLNDNASVDTDAIEMIDHERVAAVSTQIKENLERVSKALKNLEEGNWGKCAECGEKISESRLNMDPSVNLCSDCALQIEK